MYPNLQYRSLISVGQLCDSGHDVHFNKNKVTVVDVNTNKIEMEGFRDFPSGLYLTPIQTNQSGRNNETPMHYAVSVYKMRTQIDLVQYHHRSCWIPVVDTWTKAIKRGQFTTFPGLTHDIVNKYLPKSAATIKGHAKRHRQNVRSTKVKPKMTAEESKTIPARTNLVTFGTRTPTHEMATDKKGLFPTRSIKGNQYIMVAYVKDSNAILAQPIKNRT